MPVAHLRWAAANAARELAEFALLLEGRIDQHQAAPLLRRHIGGERGPAVDPQRLDARIAAQIARKRAAACGSSSQAMSRSCARSAARASAGEPG